MIKRPMKGAAVEDLSKIRFPKMASAKVDGFRCVLGHIAMTSRFRRFPNDHVHSSLLGILNSGEYLDGEIVVGKKRGSGVLQRTSSGVTSKDGKPDFKLWVFDCPVPLTRRFSLRYSAARILVKKLKHPNIRVLEHVWLQDLEELELYLSEQLELGYEGIVLRDPAAGYKEGKSTIIQQGMLKIKPFVDAEGLVVGYYEEMENTNEPSYDAIGKLKRSSAKAGKSAKGQLGGLILRDCTTGVEVRVGGGFTLQDRRSYWKIRDSLRGLRVRYKKQAVGEKDKPRHPNFVEFVDFRPDWDE